MVCCDCLVSFLGNGVLLLIIYKILSALYRIFYPYKIAEPKNLHTLAGNAKWAVVTGASDGIGKAYAKELAKQKYNVLLVSRSQSKLDSAAEEVKREAPGSTVQTFAFDFKVGTLEEYKPLLNKLEQLEIGVLVNNVGCSFDVPEVMHEFGMQMLTDITVVNNLPVTLLSASVLSQMAKRRAGVLINLSSSAGYPELNRWSVYSSTKRYVLHLTSILQQEYEPQGITVQCLTPWMVSTTMTKNMKPNFFVMTPDAFVRSALRAVGLISVTTGCFSHQIQKEILDVIPQFIKRPAALKASLAVKKQAEEERKKAKQQ